MQYFLLTVVFSILSVKLVIDTIGIRGYQLTVMLLYDTSDMFSMGGIGELPSKNKKCLIMWMQ